MHRNKTDYIEERKYLDTKKLNKYKVDRYMCLINWSMQVCKIKLFLLLNTLLLKN